MKFLVALLLLLSGFAINFAKQADDEKLSPNEEQEIRQFAKQFVANLEKTRDLTPYLNRPPASDLMDKAFHDRKDPDDLIQNKLASKIGKYQTRRFYIALWNVDYLSDSYIYSRFLLEKTAIRDLPPEQQYPPNVAMFMNRNPIIKKWWATKDLSDSDTVVTTLTQFRSLLHTYEHAAALMRRLFKNHPPEQAEVYRQNLVYLEPFLYKIALDRCSTKEYCAGLPLHTLTIKVNLPVLDLVLARLHGRLQILVIGIGDD